MARLGRGPGGLLAIGLLAAWGCGAKPSAPTAPPQPFRGTTIEVATVDDPAVLPVVGAQRGEWSATRGAEARLAEGRAGPDATSDVLVFRGEHLGDLLGRLTPLPESVVAPPPPPAEPADGPEPTQAEAPADPVRFSDVAPAYRDQASKYGGVRMALPLGGSALVLAYHREAFEREANRAAADVARLPLKPPETWAQLDALARFFHGRDWDGDGADESGLAVALGADPDRPEGLGESVFLARAASLGQHPHQYSFVFDADTMEPRIGSPPFVEALQGLVDWASCGPAGMASFDAEAARAAFARGEAALLIDRAERVADWGRGKGIGVAPLPGSERVYDPAARRWEEASPPNRPSYLPFGGGWLVGVSQKSPGPRREAAIDFARYLIGPDTASRLRSDRAFPMLAVRTSQLALGPADPRSAPGADAQQWSEAVRRTLLAPRVVLALRIPEADGYLADLARGRLAAIRGDRPAESALADVARAWSERTKALGVARQLWHYRRSLNSLATTPEPPER